MRIIVRRWMLILSQTASVIRPLAHALLRVGLGINFFMHGLSRIPHLAAFVNHTEKMFAKTWLPLPVVIATGYTIPFIEVALGAALILGLFFAAGIGGRFSFHVRAYFRSVSRPELERRFRAAHAV